MWLWLWTWLWLRTCLGCAEVCCVHDAMVSMLRCVCHCACALCCQCIAAGVSACACMCDCVVKQHIGHYMQVIAAAAAAAYFIFPLVDLNNQTMFCMKTGHFESSHMFDACRCWHPQYSTHSHRPATGARQGGGHCGARSLWPS